MQDKNLEKSKKYPGIYWRMVKRADGLGEERMYYVLYRRGGRGSKQIFEPVGRASEGMNESKANRERGARIEGKPSNAEKRAAAKKDRLTGGKPLTLGRLWEIYSEANAEKSSIAKMDGYNFKNHLAHISARRIKDLTTADIAAIRKKSENSGLSPQTVKHILGLVRRMLRHGEKLGLFAMPANLVFEMPKVDNVKTENMTTAQLAAYWKALDDEPDQDAAALMRLALFTGMRRGALFGLKWSDVDFENAILTLRGENAKKGKTDHVPLNEAALNVLRAIKRKSDYVFPGRDGEARKAYSRIARRVREKAGLPKNFRPLHGLRHTFASALASSGQVDLYTLQKLLTHESPQMTQRYAHLADEALRRGVNVANALAGAMNEREK